MHYPKPGDIVLSLFCNYALLQNYFLKSENPAQKNRSDDKR